MDNQPIDFNLVHPLDTPYSTAGIVSDGAASLDRRRAKEMARAIEIEAKRKVTSSPQPVIDEEKAAKEAAGIEEAAKALHRKKAAERRKLIKAHEEEAAAEIEEPVKVEEETEA